MAHWYNLQSDKQLTMTRNTLPVGLYIHIPWCVRKCPYCDFNSHEYRSAGNSDESLPMQIQADYLGCLKKDLDGELKRLAELRSNMDVGAKANLLSIFIGGGTPSLCSPDFYQDLFDYIRQETDCGEHTEITLEANPGTVDAGFFRGYRKAGINRLSMGVQSFNNESLESLGRIHSGEDVLRAFDIARDAGFDNINLDIMHGLPRQTVTAAIDDLGGAIELGPEHISWYQLTIEKNTAFYSSPPLIPKEDTLAEIENQGYALLEKNHYKRYEVSAYAKDDRQCVHNLNYWRFGDYLAIGAGAHGKLTRLVELAGETEKDSTGQSRAVEPIEIVRRWRTRAPKDYLSSSNSLAGDKLINKDELSLEFLMNAFRLIDGFSVADYQRSTGLSFTTIEPSIAELQQKGLVKRCESQISLTTLGLRFLDAVLAEF